MSPFWLSTGNAVLFRIGRFDGFNLDFCLQNNPKLQVSSGD